MKKQHGGGASMRKHATKKMPAKKVAEKKTPAKKVAADEPPPALSVEGIKKGDLVRLNMSEDENKARFPKTWKKFVYGVSDTFVVVRIDKKSAVLDFEEDGKGVLNAASRILTYEDDMQVLVASITKEGDDAPEETSDDDVEYL